MRDGPDVLEGLRGLLDHLPEPALLCDRDGRVVYANPRLRDLWGAGPETASPDELDLRRHPLVLELELTAQVERALSGEVVTISETPAPGRFFLGRPDPRRAETLYLDVTASPVEGPSGAVDWVLVVVRDVTERRETRAALGQKEVELAKAHKMEAIGRLASGVAHDFNNLLTIVLGHGALARDGLPEDSPVREDIEEVLRAGERGAVLTRQLLVFGRRQVLRPERLDLNQVVSDVARLLGRVIGEDVALSVELGSDIGTLVADRGQIEQVLMNLAVNARDAMPGGGRLSIGTARQAFAEGDPARPRDLAPGEYARLTVTDSGLGMSADVLAHAFEPFFTTKKGGKGSGLGLATVYGIVTQSGGRVAVESREGAGTVFDIHLPLDGGARSPRASGVSAAAPRGGGETVLLVEDDDAVRGLVRRALDAQGYRVIAAVDGLEALRVLETLAEPIDLVITDIVMPRMKGPELVGRLARRDPDLLVLYISGYPDEWSLLRECLTREESLLQKPFTTDTLLRKVREILDGHAEPREG